MMSKLLIIKDGPSNNRERERERERERKKLEKLENLAVTCIMFVLILLYLELLMLYDSSKLNDALPVLHAHHCQWKPSVLLFVPKFLPLRFACLHVYSCYFLTEHVYHMLSACASSQLTRSSSRQIKISSDILTFLETALKAFCCWI